MKNWKNILTVAISVLTVCAAICGLIIFFREDLQRVFSQVKDKIGEKKCCCCDDLADFDDV